MGQVATETFLAPATLKDDKMNASSAPPETAVELSFIVIAYRSAATIDACLDSLGRATRRTFEVVVLDNSSPDTTLSKVVQRAGCRVLLARENLGFAQGCNVASAFSRGRFLIFVNPDAVVHPGSADALVDFLEDTPLAGPVGGLTLYEDGSVDAKSCWGRQTMWSTFCFGTGLSRLFKGSKLFDPESLAWVDRRATSEVGTVTGYFMGMRRADWEAVQGMDATFFMYGDDTDLSERSRRVGLKPMITPGAVATHIEGGSSDTADRVVMMMRGRVTYLSRHWGALSRRVGPLLLLLGVFLRAHVRPSAHETSWADVWRRRTEWLSPYPSLALAWPPACADDVVPVGTTSS